MGLAHSYVGFRLLGMSPLLLLQYMDRAPLVSVFMSLCRQCLSVINVDPGFDEDEIPQCRHPLDAFPHRSSPT